MAMHVAIQGSNGWKGQGIPSGMTEKLNWFNGGCKNISVVALGHNEQWCIISSDGAWRSDANLKGGFSDKMKEIEAKNIKSICFGPDDTWAIVMESGACHAHGFSGTSGPLDAIKEHQGKIKAVAMTPNKGEWIVVYGNDGWTSQGMEQDMTSYMRGLKNAGGDNNIKNVILGRSSSKWLVKSHGNYRYTYDANSNFSDNVEKSNHIAFQ